MTSRKLTNEQNLQNLQQNIIKTSMNLIIKHLKSLNDIRDKLKLIEKITFYNHLNFLNNDVDEMIQRLTTQQLKSLSSFHSTFFTFRSRSNQICVYTTIENFKKSILIVEYKASHKLILVHFRHILRLDRSSLILDEIINEI